MCSGDFLASIWATIRRTNRRHNRIHLALGQPTIHNGLHNNQPKTGVSDGEEYGEDEAPGGRSKH